MSLGQVDDADRYWQIDFVANLEGDFKLDPEDVNKIDALDKKIRFNEPSSEFGYNFFR